MGHTVITAVLTRLVTELKADGNMISDIHCASSIGPHGMGIAGVSFVSLVNPRGSSVTGLTSHGTLCCL